LGIAATSMEQTMSADSAAYAKFEDGWEQDGVGKDGLPTYKPRLYIVLSNPPHLQVRREAEEEDIEMFSEPYKLYLKQRAGRDLSKIEGFPLVLWPALTHAECDQLLGQGIFTVEALAKLTGRTGSKTPSGILELAARAKRMLDMQKAGGKYEATIDELGRERDALHAELIEMRTALATANSTINNLQMRIAGIALPAGRAA